MKSFSQYIYESQLNEGFKDFIKNIYDIELILSGLLPCVLTKN